MRGPADFGAAFTALLEAAGANPDSVVRALNGALSRNTLYDWKKGAHLPNDTRLLLQVVHLCLRLAGADTDLRGAPRDVRGWLDLLAEAKQIRDNQAAWCVSASGRSSLRGLDDSTLLSAAAFLENQAKYFLGTLGNLVVSRRARADQLLGQLAQAQDSRQTPRCVARPKILPAGDLSVAYRHVGLLRAHRKALLGVGRVDERVLDSISALRGLLEEIYGVRIVFLGEKVLATGNGGQTPGAAAVVANPDIDFDPRIQDPIITTTRVLPDQGRTVIVAEGNPPQAVAPSGSIFVVTVEARAPRAVILHGARVVVLSRRPPRRACMIKGVAGGLDVRRFDVDLDCENPQMRMRGERDFPLTVSPDDPEEFWVQAVTAANEITWTVAVDWVVNGIAGTTMVNHAGPPFSLYPVDLLIAEPGKQSLRTSCDYGAHEDGCPTLTLKKLGGSIGAFSSERGPEFTGISALRDMLRGG
ncbi:hypothetical protein IW249_005172 [Micromonospora vinacea]|uniref:Uncharacterized protein n=1 Tax=Micromonospora vinacea TaxID=709878 RepID=A0ABS0K7Z1_9ACTN|nr:hypothetical protein [Micromonospora vinacea]MBG6104758.1 hypothetical protein [Micromonospora vinacea]WTA64524.1 hypothetical protein OHB51_18525 [Micromonospora sp. NBC_00855]